MPKPLPPLVHHGSTGFQLPETLARKIDGLSRALPRDFTYRRIVRKSDEFTIDEGERTDVSFITTDALDRDGQVVLPSGGDWSSYNRVVTFAHHYDQLPVGSNWWIRPRGSGVDRQDALSTEAGRLGGCAVAAVGDIAFDAAAGADVYGQEHRVLPLHMRNANPEEVARRSELRGVQVIDRWVGVEYAVVPVPCNPEAEMQAVAKGLEMGLIDEHLLRLISEWATNDPSAPTRPSLDTLRPLIRQRIAHHIRDHYRRIAGRVS